MLFSKGFGDEGVVAVDEAMKKKITIHTKPATNIKKMKKENQFLKNGALIPCYQSNLHKQFLYFLKECKNIYIQWVGEENMSFTCTE